MTYDVTATPWANGWELDIEGVGVTQSIGEDDAERMVRSYLALEGCADAHAAQVRIQFSC